MRVLFDTNIFISYLLKSDKDKTITTIIDAGFENKYQLILPHDIISEFNRKLTEKKYLAVHISKLGARDFTEAITTIAEKIPVITEPVPEVGRDKKDDYLLAYAMVGEADYLVSGDKDLQVIGRIGRVKIVSPQDFLKKLTK